MNSVELNKAWLATLESLFRKASIEELYVLHGMLLFHSSIYGATGNQNASFNFARAETALIDVVKAKGGYPQDTTELQKLHVRYSGS